jgi:hypothetical protein
VQSNSPNRDETTLHTARCNRGRATPEG